MGLTLQLLPLLMERQGHPAWLIGANAAMGPIGILMAGPFLPRIIGNMGTRLAVYVAVATMVAVLIALKLSPTVWLWFPLRFIFGVAAGVLFTVSKGWVLTFAKKQERQSWPRDEHLYQRACCHLLGRPAHPAVDRHQQLSGSLWAIGIVCVMASILPLAFVKVSHDTFRQEHSGSFFRFVGKAPLLCSRWVLQPCSTACSISFFFTIFGMRHGLELDVASRILGVGIIGNVLLFYPLGWLADHWSRRGVIVVTACSTIVLSLSLIVLINTIFIWPATVLLLASAFGVYVVALAAMGDSFKGPDVMAGSAAFAAMWDIGGLIGPPLAGVAIDAFGINAMPFTIASFYVILLIGLALNGGQLVREPSHG